MAVKIFILTFAAIFWQAQSQLYDCSVQNPCAASFPVQSAAPFSGNNCFPPNLVSVGLKSNVIPTSPVISTRPLNLCLDDESSDFIFGISRCGPIPNIPGPCILDIPQIYPIADETCRPNVCANDCCNIPKPTFLIPNLPSLRPICALEGCLDNPCAPDICTFAVSPEANLCLGPIYQATPKLPNPIFGINRVTPCCQNSVLCESPLNIEPCRQVPNIGKVNVPSNVQTSTTTTSTSVNVRPDSYTPSVFRGFNQPTVSSIATSEATASVSTPSTYSSNIFGTNITPSQTSVATAESTVTTSNVGPTNVFSPISGVFNNLLRPATVAPSACPSNIPRSFNSYVFTNDKVSPVKASTTCKSLSTDMVPVDSVTPNFFGGIPQTVCFSELAVSPPCIETPLFYPSSCRQTSCSNPCNFRPEPLPLFGGLGSIYSLDQAFNLAGSCAEASTLIESQGVTTTSTTSATSTSTVTDINNPLTPCDDEVISSSSASSSTTVVVEEIVPVAECFEVIEPVISCVADAFSVLSPSVLCQNPYNIGLLPVTLQVEIPSSFASTLTSNLGVCSSPALSSCLPISTAPVVYELQIPSSIPAQLSCSLGSVPSTVPVLYMNVEPIGICSC